MSLCPAILTWDRRSEKQELLLTITIIIVIFICPRIQSSSAQQNITLSAPTNFTTHLLNNNSTTPSIINVKTAESSEAPTNTIIAAVSAIAGGGLGAYFTYLFSTRHEKRKTNDQSKSIRSLVKDELSRYLKFLEDIKNNSVDEPKSVGNFDKSINKKSEKFNDIHFILNSFPRNYTKLSTETTSKVFHSLSLAKLEEAYQGIEVFIGRIRYRNEKFDIMYYFENDLKILITKVNSAIDSIEIT
jgi:hypothetical protein